MNDDDLGGFIVPKKLMASFVYTIQTSKAVSGFYDSPGLIAAWLRFQGKLFNMPNLFMLGQHVDYTPDFLEWKRENGYND